MSVAGGGVGCVGSVGAWENVSSGVGSSCDGPSDAGAVVGDGKFGMVLGGALVVGVVGCAGVGGGVVALAAVGLEADDVATVGMKPTVSIEVFFWNNRRLASAAVVARGCCCLVTSRTCCALLAGDAPVVVV